MSSEPISNAEARRIALSITEQAEQERTEQAEKEARFERLQIMDLYVNPALQMMIDKGTEDDLDDGAVSSEDFKTKYGATKQEVNYAFILLELANYRQDFMKRNEVYDFFAQILGI